MGLARERRGVGVPGVGAVGAIKAGESRMDKISAKQEDSTADMGTHNSTQQFPRGPHRLHDSILIGGVIPSRRKPDMRPSHDAPEDWGR